jgi:hypothetical protein
MARPAKLRWSGFYRFCRSLGASIYQTQGAPCNGVSGRSILRFIGLGVLLKLKESSARLHPGSTARLGISRNFPQGFDGVEGGFGLGFLWMSCHFKPPGFFQARANWLNEFRAGPFSRTLFKL